VRIASLVPSLTETMIVLGLKPWLVARTGFCVEPRDAVGDVPKVGGTKDVDLARLRDLRPTHVVVNVDENRLDTVEALREFVPHIVVTHPCSPDDNLALIDQLLVEFGGLPGVAERAQRLRDALRSAIDEVRAKDRRVQRVLYLVWRDPWITVARDTYISRMLDQVGWQTLPAVEGGAHGTARYPKLAGDEPWLADVERVLLSSEPYRFGPAHLCLAEELCPRAKPQLIDGALLSWYGARAVAGLRYLRVLAQATQ
jgi:ABC-type Fe3+-hydroxamate transport system substrate-binding protein